MAQLVRCYFREIGIGAADSSFEDATDFEFALDVEFTQAEINIGGQFRVLVGVNNFNTNVVTIPAPAATDPGPPHNTAAVVGAPRNQTFAYTIPALTGVAGEFLDAHTALVVGVTGPDTDICETSCVIIPAPP